MLSPVSLKELHSLGWKDGVEAGIFNSSLADFTAPGNYLARKDSHA